MRNNFGLIRDVRQVNIELLDSDYPIVIDGADVYDTLCPVSKLTGHRESPFKLLGKLTGANSQLLNQVLAELPSVHSDAKLTDEDRADYLVSRLCTGTPAENAVVAEWIMRDLDTLGFSQRQAVQHQEDAVEKISFADNVETKSE